MSIQERIIKIIDNKYAGNRTQFGKAIGVGQSTVGGWIGGQRNIGFNVVDKILHAFPDINVTWLLTGEGTMFKETPISENNNITFNPNLTALIKVDNKYYSANTLDELKDIVTQIEKN